MASSSQLTPDTPSHLSSPHRTTPSPSQTPTTTTTTSASKQQTSTDARDNNDATTFRYPPHYSFPPFFTLQPNLTTRASQLSSWSSLILSYCAFHRSFRLHASDAVFSNASLRRALPAEDAGEVLAHMVERGRATFVAAEGKSAAKKKELRKEDRASALVYVWWKSAEQWAGIISQWIEDTGQKGSVLTLYELLKGDAAERTGWWGMPEDMLRIVLSVLVKRGKANVFGEEGEEGVKFF